MLSFNVSLPTPVDRTASNREEHPRMLLLLREAQHAADTPPHGGVAAGVRAGPYTHLTLPTIYPV